MTTRQDRILSAEWGEVNGRVVRCFTLTNAGGIALRLTDLGASLVGLALSDRQGRAAAVVLGFETPQEYFSGTTYFGATVGRYGNRIRRGSFRLDGREFSLARNEGANHLHGGTLGFDKRLWAAVIDPEANAVHFHLVSPDEEDGYPGRLDAQTSYHLGDDDTLRIEMTASVTRPCPVNLVHHSYWNLAGHDSGPVVGHEIQIHADLYTPVDDELLPTGEILSVSRTPFDFRTPKLIGLDIDAVANSGAGRMHGVGGGYDHNFVLRGEDGAMRTAIRVRDPSSGRGFELATNQPGMHLYTGGYLEGTRGKTLARYPRFGGFTLETQKFPDSPNVPHFPTARVEPGTDYRHVMVFQFFR